MNLGALQVDTLISTEKIAFCLQYARYSIQHVLYQHEQTILILNEWRDFAIHAVQTSVQP